MAPTDRETGERPVAVVTGASRGIGRATAIALAGAGFDVAVGARTARAGEGRDDARPEADPLPGSIEETVADVEAAGGRGMGVRMDLHEPDSLSEAVDDVMAGWGGIDVLVNNAVDTGPGSMSRFLETDPADLERKLAANCTAQLALIRHLLPGWIERGRGVVVNVTSAVAVSDPIAPAGEGGWGLAYAASKAAFHRIAPILAIEHGSDGLRIYNLDPGTVLTEKMERNQREMGLEGRFAMAPPSVPAVVIGWLALGGGADIDNGSTVSAQREALRRGLHPDWRGRAS
jgi:NAD(P)-dependent dehydrogenase (short-subunit alcohol dehydrogenase family)